ncbi:hypothetical protein [Sporichthya sp.]|uniref:hypothetical protein n=1 Tax=Sporichthya sp. TaxID=65475 RepID=UPI0025D0AD86|nr:hypothetical protein [Sporichthya sp.]
MHAVIWARSDRQAALYVLAAAQQRLFTAQEFADEVAKIRRDKRRLMLRGLLADIASGIESIGERDFARMCRERGFPEPARQTVRYTETGRLLLDNDFDPYLVTAEIDGSQHLDPSSWISDAFKQNVVSLEGRVVIRIPNLALRLDPDPFFDQLEQALHQAGWAGPRADTGARDADRSSRRPKKRASWRTLRRTPAYCGRPATPSEADVAHEELMLGVAAPVGVRRGVDGLPLDGVFERDVLRQLVEALTSGLGVGRHAHEATPRPW